MHPNATKPEIIQKKYRKISATRYAKISLVLNNKDENGKFMKFKSRWLQFDAVMEWDTWYDSRPSPFITALHFSWITNFAVFFL